LSDAALPHQLGELVLLLAQILIMMAELLVLLSLLGVHLMVRILLAFLLLQNSIFVLILLKAELVVAEQLRELRHPRLGCTRGLWELSIVQHTLLGGYSLGRGGVGQVVLHLGLVAVLLLDGRALRIRLGLERHEIWILPLVALSVYAEVRWRSELTRVHDLRKEGGVCSCVLGGHHVLI